MDRLLAVQAVFLSLNLLLVLLVRRVQQGSRLPPVTTEVEEVGNYQLLAAEECARILNVGRILAHSEQILLICIILRSLFIRSLFRSIIYIFQIEEVIILLDHLEGTGTLVVDVCPELVGRMMFAHLGKPFGRGEGKQVVAAVHRLFYLDRVGDDVVEALWRVGEALQLHLKAEAVAHVEVAAIVEPGQCIAIFIELILIGRQFAEELIEAVVLWCRFILLV